MKCQLDVTVSRGKKNISQKLYFHDDVIVVLIRTSNCHTKKQFVIC